MLEAMESEIKTWVTPIYGITKDQLLELIEGYRTLLAFPHLVASAALDDGDCAQCGGHRREHMTAPNCSGFEPRRSRPAVSASAALVLKYSAAINALEAIIEAEKDDTNRRTLKFMTAFLRGALSANAGTVRA